MTKLYGSLHEVKKTAFIATRGLFIQLSEHQEEEDGAVDEADIEQAKVMIGFVVVVVAPMVLETV